MPVEEALRAITLLPAGMLGVSDLVGSIEPNKDADLVILYGDPLKINTWVETTLVNGKVVYERQKDEKLKRLLQEPPK
jgi:imidazolonepropionase-like amidohydrolase